MHNALSYWFNLTYWISNKGFNIPDIFDFQDFSNGHLGAGNQFFKGLSKVIKIGSVFLLKTDKHEQSKFPRERSRWVSGHFIQQKRERGQCECWLQQGLGSLGRAPVPAVARLAGTSSVYFDTLYWLYLYMCTPVTYYTIWYCSKYYTNGIIHHKLYLGRTLPAVTRLAPAVYSLILYIDGAYTCVPLYHTILYDTEANSMYTNCIIYHIPINYTVGEH